MLNPRRREAGKGMVKFKSEVALQEDVRGVRQC